MQIKKDGLRKSLVPSRQCYSLSRETFCHDQNVSWSELSNMVASKDIWLLNIWNVARETEELIFILFNFNWFIFKLSYVIGGSLIRQWRSRNYIFIFKLIFLFFAYQSSHFVHTLLEIPSTSLLYLPFEFLITDSDHWTHEHCHSLQHYLHHSCPFPTHYKLLKERNLTPKI